MRYDITEPQILSLNDDQAEHLLTEIQDSMAHLGHLEHLLFKRKHIQDMKNHPELFQQPEHTQMNQPPKTPDLRTLLERAISALGADAVSHLLTGDTK